MLSMLGAWRAHGLDEVLRTAWRRGIVLCGPSAGSLCWFAQALSAFHGAPTAGARARPAAVLQLRPLRRRARPPRRVPPRRRRRHARRLRRRRRGGAALPRHPPAAGRELAPRGAAPTGSALSGGRVRETRLAVTYLGEAPDLGARRRRSRRTAGRARACASSPRARARVGGCVSAVPRAGRGAAADLRDGRRRLHDGAVQPAARRLRAVARRERPSRGSCSCPRPRATPSAQLNAFKERFAHRTCVASDLSLFRLSETTSARCGRS